MFQKILVHSDVLQHCFGDAQSLCQVLFLQQVGDKLGCFVHKAQIQGDDAPARTPWQTTLVTDSRNGQSPVILQQSFHSLDVARSPATAVSGMPWKIHNHCPSIFEQFEPMSDLHFGHGFPPIHVLYCFHCHSHAYSHFLCKEYVNPLLQEQRHKCRSLHDAQKQCWLSKNFQQSADRTKLHSVTCVNNVLSRKTLLC